MGKTRPSELVQVPFMQLAFLTDPRTFQVALARAVRASMMCMCSRVTDSLRPNERTSRRGAGAKFEMKIKATAKLASFGISLIADRHRVRVSAAWDGMSRKGSGFERNPIWPRSDFGDGSSREL